MQKNSFIVLLLVLLFSQEKIKGETKIENSNIIEEVIELLKSSRKPLFLFGGGLSREVVSNNLIYFEKFGVPIAVTWNGSDRVSAEYKYYCGRPNTYGMRYSNICLQRHHHKPFQK
jgi:thiamine pyrophosphate-dependent acetolactate synthase large subunit-like protein